jgi:hypothetical protein
MVGMGSEALYCLRGLIWKRSLFPSSKRPVSPVLDRVRKTGKPNRVTRFGQAVAEVVPPGGARTARRLGTGIDTGVILGNIVGPIGDESDGEAAQDPQDEQYKKDN